MKNALRCTAAALLLAVAAGCNDSDPGEVIVDLDVADVQLTVQELVFPINASLEATTQIQDAFEDLVVGGFEFDRAGRPMPLALSALDGGPVEKLTVLPVVIPAGFVGKTFVYDTQQNVYVADDARADAPANGVRVIWYDLDGFGDLIVPLVERGYADLVPADTGQMSRLDVRIVEVNSGTELTLADFVHGYRTTNTSPDTTYYDAEGFYADAVDQTEFDAAGVTVVATSGELVSGVSRLDLTRGTERYLLDVEATIVDTEQYVARVEQGSVHTVLDLLLGGSGEQGGSLSYNGSVVATVVYDGARFQFVPPGGGSFSGSQQQELLNLTQTLVLTGLNLPLVMPFFWP